MKHSDSKAVREAAPARAYEAPRIELLVTGPDLEREVHYAGSPSAAG